MAAFNARTIEAAKPGVARREISDPTLPAMRLIVQPSGVKSWAVRYGLGGQKHKLTLGGYPVLSLADAREAARTALQSVAAGTDPRIAKRNGTSADASLAAAVTLYNEKYVSTLRPGTQSNVRRELGYAVAAWGSRPLASIIRRDVIDLADIAAKRGPNARNAIIKNLSAFFRWCESEDRVTVSPARGVRRTKAATRDRVLDDRELAAVWRAAETAGPAGPLARLLLLTGCRRTEISALEWSEVTADAIVLPAERTKTAKAHKVALTDAMRRVLDALPRHPGRRFVINDSDAEMCVSGFTKHCLDGAGIPAWTFHDLRRSFASGCARLGVAPHIVEKCLNHVTGGVAGIYNRHTYEAECKAAWELWSRHILSLVA